MEERELMRRWVQAWEEAWPKLEAIRRNEIRQADNLKVLAMLEGAFNLALREPRGRPLGWSRCSSFSPSSADDRAVRSRPAPASFLRQPRLAFLLYRRDCGPKMGRAARVRFRLHQARTLVRAQPRTWSC